MRGRGSEAAGRLEQLRGAATPEGVPLLAQPPPVLPSSASASASSSPDPWVPHPLTEQVDGAEVVPPPPPRTVRPVAAAAAVVIALLVAAAAWLHASGAGEAVQLPPRQPLAASGPTGTSSGAVAPGAGGPGPTAGGVPGATSAELVVDVEGRVRRPGLQRLPPGSRVADAVRAAGGPTAGAMVAALNLARVLVDGEQILVPGPGAPTSPPGGGSAVGGAAAAGGPPAPAAAVDLNTATQDGLDALPGVGPVLASRIVAWRTQHGRFTSVDELAEVPGIGPKAMERLRPLVRV